MVSRNSSQQATLINCSKNSSLSFVNCDSVHITGIKFLGCGNNRVEQVKNFTLQNSTLQGRGNSGTAVEIIESEIYNGVFTSNTGIHAVIQYKFCIETLVGGALVAKQSNITIRRSQFYQNQAGAGGAIFLYKSNANIESCNFTKNEAIGEITQCGFHIISMIINITVAGALLHVESNVEIANSLFRNNSASFGGVILTFLGALSIQNDSTFLGNIAWRYGGVIRSEFSTITLTGPRTFLDGNLALAAGGVASLYSSSISVGNSLLMTNNSGVYGSVFYAFNSSIAIHNYLNMSGNSALAIRTGLLTLFQSNLTFFGSCNFEHNEAENGAVIYSSESRININGDLMISGNRARKSGGGILLRQSELVCQESSTLTMTNNAANEKGGAIYAIESTIKIVAWVNRTLLIIRNNSATTGGGISLETNAKMYVVKYSDSYSKLVDFWGNSVDYGGAVFVDDDTRSGTCTREDIECFIQELSLLGGASEVGNSLSFEHNHAKVQGSDLFGGLLHRCTISLFITVARTSYTNTTLPMDGLSYYKAITSSALNKISSHPIKVCQCISDRPNCTIQHHLSYMVKKGGTFFVSLVAIDQVGHPVGATIQSLLSSNKSGLLEGQLTRSIPGKCTNLTFNVVSPDNSEQLSLYASNGPCKSAESATLTVDINFLPCVCPVGFQNSKISEVNCTCECHVDIVPYVSKCDIQTQSFVKLPQTKVWITSTSFDNKTGFIIYPNCPFDYCKSNQSIISVNLSQPNGADAQCTYGRSALLCGSCESGLSLSLGSSRCIQCPTYWPALLMAITIAAIIAGILLVAALLILNMTVAVGSLNGLIFYANILSANRSIFFPFQEYNCLKIANVLISWINLDIGIDSCHFNGMDTYTKLWLQLAFPFYVFILVGAIILCSTYSIKISNLLGRKNPVATLATLILLSYAKVLEVTFRALLAGTMTYPSGPHEIVWLPDATIKYLSLEHCIVLIVSITIVLIGLLFTVLVFPGSGYITCLSGGYLSGQGTKNCTLSLKLTILHTTPNIATGLVCYSLLVFFCISEW